MCNGNDHIAKVTKVIGPISGPMIMKLGMEQYVLKSYKVYIP